MPLATTAAWLVLPPRIVKMPSAATHSRKVIRVGFFADKDTRDAMMVPLNSFSDDSATFPEAAPGPALRPLATKMLFALHVLLSDRRLEQQLNKLFRITRLTLFSRR